MSDETVKKKKVEYICDNYVLQGECSKENCQDIHQENRLTYYWLFDKFNYTIPREHQMCIEKSYCDADTQNSDVLLLNNRIQYAIDFEQMIAMIQLTNADGNVLTKCDFVTRSSTRSYIYNQQALTTTTQWRWYIKMNLEGSWKWYPFETTSNIPCQYILEMKYTYGQDIYRFRENLISKFNSSSEKFIFLLNFRSKEILNLANQEITSIRRRPLFIDSDMIIEGKSYPSPQQPVDYMISQLQDIPKYWSPLDSSTNYELIPLNPNTNEYKWVSTKFKIAGVSIKVMDVCRLQSPKLWQLFFSKKNLMNVKKEWTLFHGTSSEIAVQSILSQNIDPRLNARKVHGSGSYFTPYPSIAHNYTKGGIRWVFICRVCAGDYTKSNEKYVRPPPKNPSEPHGELFDSVVDNVDKPKIVVIFDQNQCYPEYLLSYVC